MALPLATTPDDIKSIVKYLNTKPSGATPGEMKAVLGGSLVDGRKISTCQTLGVISREGERIKLTADVGRRLARAEEQTFSKILLERVQNIPAYASCLEWAHHQDLNEITSSDIGAHWHDNHRPELGTDNQREIGFRATCFMQLAEAAKLGKYVLGRKGQLSRLALDKVALKALVEAVDAFDREELAGVPEGEPEVDRDIVDQQQPPTEKSTPVRTEQLSAELPQGIFVGHGKSKKPLEQLKGILDKFKVPYKVAVEEPNLGRPIGEKVSQTMRSCNCAILIFSADEEFQVGEQKVWRSSENVVHELGAASLLYGNRLVILKEDGVDLATNYRDLCYISFPKDQLASKAMEILQELIGFNILKLST